MKNIIQMFDETKCLWSKNISFIHVLRILDNEKILDVLLKPAGVQYQQILVG